MKKICYNFNKGIKECSPNFKSYLDTVEYVISPYVRLNAEAFECKIIEHFDNDLFVGYPPYALGNVEFLTYYPSVLEENCWTGTIHLGIDGTYPRYFRLKDNVLYICKSTYVEE